MARGGDYKGSINSVGIHAALVIVVHGDESPVRDDTSNPNGAIGSRTGDQVFDGCSIKKLDIGELEDL
jgi:hypothetical protein